MRWPMYRAIPARAPQQASGACPGRHPGRVQNPAPVPGVIC